MANQIKTPLKVVVSGSNFHRKLSLYQRMKLHWSEPLKSHIRNFSSGVWGWSDNPPMGGYVKYIIMYQFWSPKLILFMFWQWKRTFWAHLGHYTSEQKLFNPNRAVKVVEKRCKSAQMSTKCWSIILKFGQKILCNLLNLTAQVLELHLV